MTHPEWTMENSLTSPEDRDRNNKWKPNQGAPPLTEEEVKMAVDALDNTSFVDKFPKVDRTYADPALPMQLYGLISFTPAKGATPNSNGVFGFAKLRGNYATELEAKQRAEHIIRNIDSYHQIYHTYVGRPFPITNRSTYSADTDEIDIRKETTSTVSSSIKDKKDEERRIVSEIKEKEEALLKKSRKEEEEGEDPYEVYITLRVKKAQLQWTYIEHQKKLKEIKDSIIKSREDLAKLDDEHPTFKDSYLEKYMNARKEAGIVESKEETENNFIKFLVDDAELDF
jgi:hypothetical protein